MNNFRFRTGDRVRWGGIEGVVVKVTCAFSQDDTLEVVFDADPTAKNQWFLSDGRIYDYHTEPSLVLIERPKKKVKKHGWVNIFGLDAAPGQTFSSRVYTSCEDAAGAAVILGGTLYKILAFDYEIEE